MSAFGRRTPRFHKVAEAAGATILQSVQSDYGLTFGGTLLATGTSPPVVTISGSSALPIGVRVEITTLGALGVAIFKVSYNGGASYPITGAVTAATYDLTGAGQGLQLQFPAGPYAVNNVYRTTCSGWADQWTGAKNYSQATAANQPVIAGAALGSFPSLTFDGTNDYLSSSLNLAAPATTATLLWMVFRQVTWTNARRLCGGGSTTHVVQQVTTSPALMIYDSTAFVSSNTGAAVGTWVRGEFYWSGSTGDFVMLGSTYVAGGVSAGNGASTGRHLGASAGGSCSNIEVAALMYMSGLPACRSVASGGNGTLDAAVASKYAGLVTL